MYTLHLHLEGKTGPTVFAISRLHLSKVKYFRYENNYELRNCIFINIENNLEL